jgi:hypothetical protein
MPTSNDHLELQRVRRHTSDAALEAIDQKTRDQTRAFAYEPSSRIDQRIRELARERDVEQVLETNASVLALTGAILGTTVDRRFFGLTGIILGFLTQHAMTGWCPPVPIFRAMGVRTREEIDQERYALKALRGDFQELRDEGLVSASVDRVLRAVQA